MFNFSCRVILHFSIGLILCYWNSSRAQDITALQQLSQLNSKQYAEMAERDPEAARKWAEANPDLARSFLEQNPEAQRAVADAQKKRLLDTRIDRDQRADHVLMLGTEAKSDSLRLAILAMRDSLRLDSLNRIDSLRLDSLRLDSLRLDSLRVVNDSILRDTTPKRFGIEFFTDTLNPVQFGRILPPDYRLAEGDQIQLRFWGRINSEQLIEIGSDGFVRIDAFDRREYVKGMTQRALKETIHRVLEGMPGVQGDVQVIGNQSTRLRISGAASRPGSIAIPPYHTFWQALQLSGGPSATGSLRDIRLVRSGRILIQFDLYRYLQQGTYSDVALQDGDQIHFGPVGRVVDLRQIARRSALFELTEKENLGELVDHAGGLRSADLAPFIQIERITPPELRKADQATRQILDIALVKNWQKTAMADGDLVRGIERTPEVLNQVLVQGMGIRIPGIYGFPATDSSLAGVLQRAGGLHPGALSEVQVVRIGERGGELYHLAPDSWASFKLNSQDQILVYHHRQFRDTLRVGVMGAVRKDTSMIWSQGLSLGTLLRTAQGLKDIALPYVWVRRESVDGQVQWFTTSAADADATNLWPRDQVYAIDARRFGRELPLTFFYPGTEPLILDWAQGMTLQTAIHRLGELSPVIDRKRVELYHQEMGDPNIFKSMHIISLDTGTLNDPGLLKPGMAVIFRRLPEIRDLEVVVVDGEVLRPGRYPIQDRSETVNQLLQRAGGLTTRANPHAAVILRDGENIPIRSKTDAKTGTLHLGDMKMAKDDTLRIYRDDQTIKVTGSVLSPGNIPMVPGWTHMDYIRKGAGGLLDTADVDKIYIIYPNGQSYKADCGWFCGDPIPVSGSVIVVPHKRFISPEEYASKEAKKVSFAEVMQGITATLTTVLLVLLLVNRTN